MSTSVERRTRAPHYPVNLELRDEPVLVVGGGAVAARKVAGLIDAGAAITVVAPTITESLRTNPHVRWHERPYQRGEAASYRVVVTATGDPEVDAQVARDARATGVPVNSADDPRNCSFTHPAVLRKGDLQITVSTAGRSPVLAAWLKDRLDTFLGDSIVDLLEVLAEAREELQAQGRSTEAPGWRRALDAGLGDLVAAGRVDDARALLRAELARDGLPVDVPAVDGGAR